jgi:hypothetical protein
MRYRGALAGGQHPGGFLSKMNIYMSKEYKLAQSGNVESLESQINQLASQGWEPNGSLDTQQINGKIFYTQVMVREKNDINETNSDNGKQLLHG